MSNGVKSDHTADIRLKPPLTLQPFFPLYVSDRADNEETVQTEPLYLNVFALRAYSADNITTGVLGAPHKLLI